MSGRHAAAADRYYKSRVFREHGWCKDMLLLQAGAQALGPSKLLALVLERAGLREEAAAGGEALRREASPNLLSTQPPAATPASVVAEALAPVQSVRLVAPPAAAQAPAPADADADFDGHLAEGFASYAEAEAVKAERDRLSEVCDDRVYEAVCVHVIPAERGRLS